MEKTHLWWISWRMWFLHSIGWWIDISLFLGVFIEAKHIEMGYQGSEQITYLKKPSRTLRTLQLEICNFQWWFFLQIQKIHGLLVFTQKNVYIDKKDPKEWQSIWQPLSLGQIKTLMRLFVLPWQISWENCMGQLFEVNW